MYGSVSQEAVFDSMADYNIPHKTQENSNDDGQGDNGEF